MTNKLERYVAAIQRHCHNFVVETVRLNGDGQYNDVLIVNDVFVFRFAKVKPAIDALRQEVAILRYLHRRVSLPVPDPQFCFFSSDLLGEVFMGYPLIKGRPLWRPTFQQLTDKAGRRQLAKQLASFLKGLHQIDDRPFLDQLPMADKVEAWQVMYEKIQHKLYPFMRPAARVLVSDHFERYFDRAEQLPFTPVLRHGDFGTGNILFDQSRYMVTGIIDFGATAVGDAATDFAGLYTCYGERFYQMCGEVYPEMMSALDRVDFFCGTFALQEALFGLEHDDQNAFQAGMEDYI